MIDKKIIDAAVIKYAAMEYGTTILHQDIAIDLGVKYPSQEYSTAVSKIRNRLLGMQKHLENIPKIGYRITDPDDYSEQALKYFKQGSKRIAKSKKVLDFAPEDKMSIDGLAKTRLIKDRIAVLSATIQGAKVELRLLNKPHPFKDLQNEQTSNT